MIKRLMIVALMLIVLFGAIPLVAAGAAVVIAGAIGCALTKDSVHACLLFGHDIGSALHTMFVSYWLAVMTISEALIMLIVWAVVALILLVLHRRRERRRQTV